MDERGRVCLSGCIIAVVKTKRVERGGSIIRCGIIYLIDNIRERVAQVVVLVLCRQMRVLGSKPVVGFGKARVLRLHMLKMTSVLATDWRRTIRGAYRIRGWRRLWWSRLDNRGYDRV
jgi:hypothetical protein